MAGNSQRRGRRTTPKPPPVAGSGARRRASLQGKGPTPPAEQRVWHKAYSGGEPVPERTARKQERERRAAEAAGRPPRVGTPGRLPDGPKREARQPGRSAGQGRAGGAGRASGTGRAGDAGRAGGAGGTGRSGSGELVLGRNPVLEALRAEIPATALYLARGIDLDDRVNELLRIAADRGIAIVELTRAELDKLADGVPHQGVGLPVRPFRYRPFEDLLADLAGGARAGGTTAPLLVALDGVTDPRNLGAVIRSAAGFGGHGVVVPERRAAGVTAAAWRASAGAAARLPVARVTNLTRALKACQQAGLLVVGLDAHADLSLYDLDLATDPLVLVVGSEGRGLSRLVRATCDLRVAIPMADQAGVGSLNASVAAAVTLAEVARRRAGAPGAGANTL